MDAATALRWKMRAQRSRRALPPSPPPQFDADAYAAAKTLILLANSGGGFCTTASPNKHQQLPQSAKKQETTSPDTPLPPPFHHCWLCGEERERVHECSFCHQTFATGQALGGHKRRHYDGPAIIKKPPKTETSTSPKRIAGHVRPIIDLNLPPPPEFHQL